MTLKKLFVTTALVLSPVIVVMGQGKGLNPADILKPLKDSWPTYNGDYSGKRYSALTQVNQLTVKNLTLAWTTKLTGGNPATGGFGGGGRGVNVGGEGTGDFPVGNTPTIKASALMVDGTLYLTAPDNAWAIDARDGRELWHYFWKTRGGTHIATRGFGMWNDYLFMETPDNYLVSLEAKTGKERWHKVIADFSQQYFSTMAPIVIGNHVIVGTGNDIDAPGVPAVLRSRDRRAPVEVLHRPDEPGRSRARHVAEPRRRAARRRAGVAAGRLRSPTRSSTSSAPATRRRPTPRAAARGQSLHRFAHRGQRRHRQDGVVLPDRAARHARLGLGADAGHLRRPVQGADAEARRDGARNGYFFVLDRVTGEHLLTSKYGSATNWVKNLDEKGRPMRNPEKDPSVGGSIVSPSAGGTINWEPPAFSPDTGLFYVGEDNAYSIFYLTDPDPRGSMGLGGKLESRAGTGGSFLTALDYKTGKAVWRHKYPGGGGTSGVLATAGKLVFAGDGGGNIVAHNALTGAPLWHSHIGNVTNPPQTYMLDGRQYLLVAANDTLFAFVLY